MKFSSAQKLAREDLAQLLSDFCQVCFSVFTFAKHVRWTSRRIKNCNQFSWECSRKLSDFTRIRHLPRPHSAAECILTPFGLKIHRHSSDSRPWVQAVLPRQSGKLIERLLAWRIEQQTPKSEMNFRSSAANLLLSEQPTVFQAVARCAHESIAVSAATRRGRSASSFSDRTVIRHCAQN